MRKESVILSEVATGSPCAAHVTAGKGEAVFLGCDYPAEPKFYAQLLSILGVAPRFDLRADGPGVIVTSTVSSKGDRLLHLLNVAPQQVSLTLRYKGKTLWKGRRLKMRAKSGLILPLGVSVGASRILESTAEIARITTTPFRRGVKVRPTQEMDLVVLDTTSGVNCSGGDIIRRGKRVEIRIPRSRYNKNGVKIRLG